MQPAWDLWLASQWGPSYEGPDSYDLIESASNVVVGTNPQYTPQDFFAIFPKFGGPPLLLANCGTTLNSPNVTVPASSQLAVGQLVAGPGIPDGASILLIQGPTLIVISVPATATGALALTIWISPPIPLAVIYAYIALATASLVQARWLEQWPLAMAWFVAHYLTLYARSDGNPYSTIGQIAAQGLSSGIQISKAAGDVNVTYQPVAGIEEWGSWNLTSYGQNLATMAKTIGAGPMLVY